MLKQFHLGDEAVGEPDRHVSLDPADSRVVVVHAGPAELLKQVEEHLAVPHAPGHEGQAADVGAVGTQPHQVRSKTLALCSDEANVFGSLGDFDLQKVLCSVDVGVGPRHCADVAESVAVRGDLGEVPRFGNLLNAAMDVAKFGIGVNHRFTVNLDAEGPQTVRHRVLWAHRDPHLRHDLTSLYTTLVGWFSTEALGIVVHFVEVVVADFVLLLQRVEPFRAVVGIEDAMHVLVAFKLDSDEVPRFLLVPVGANPQGLDAGHRRRLTLREREDDLNFEGDVHALKLLSHVNGVGVRCLVGDGLAHEVVDHLPAALSAAFGVVGSQTIEQ